MSAWNAVYVFRWMGQLGLPYATSHAAWQHERTVEHLATADENAELFNVDRKQLREQGYFDQMAKAITEQSVITFESALDAASLIFAHSVLDGAAFDWCRVCVLASPEDFMPYVDQKKLTVAEVRAAPLSELKNKVIDAYLGALERESLLKKLDIVFALCRPSPDFVGVTGYRFDRDRLAGLDNLRHDYVHRGGLGGRLPRGDDDVYFLWQTSNYLLRLVLRRYAIRLDPDAMAASAANPGLPGEAHFGP